MKTNLFILGLGNDIDAIKLTELFSLHGTVDSVHVAMDQKTGKSLGYGFVQMIDQAAAARAVMALNGTKMKGKTLTVRVAEKKDKKKKTGHQEAPEPVQSTPKPKRPRISRNNS